jgi:hypothetical protein
MSKIVEPARTATPQELAKYAAQGIALALNARKLPLTGPIHIICGIPRELFNVSLGADKLGELAVGAIQEHA